MNHVFGGGGEPLVLFRAPHAPRCSQVHFVEHRYTTVEIAGFSEWGPPPWAFSAQVLVVQYIRHWQVIAKALQGQVPKYGVPKCDPELWCICSGLQKGLEPAITWQSAIPVQIADCL